MTNPGSSAMSRVNLLRPRSGPDRFLPHGAQTRNRHGCRLSASRLGWREPPTTRTFNGSADVADVADVLLRSSGLQQLRATLRSFKGRDQYPESGPAAFRGLGACSRGRLVGGSGRSALRRILRQTGRVIRLLNLHSVGYISKTRQVTIASDLAILGQRT